MRARHARTAATRPPIGHQLPHLHIISRTSRVHLAYISRTSRGRTGTRGVCFNPVIQSRGRRSSVLVGDILGERLWPRRAAKP
eukprot:5057888-Prymnesium_polylepis.1